jgi:tellurite resistance protein TerC
MLAQIEITPLHWAGFLSVILLFLALDLGVFHRHAHVVRFREALAWTVVWFALAMAFAYFFVRENMGEKTAILFITGYITELSLSMDNVFVMALIFTYFRVPTEYQHRVLFWGILGALIMRGLLIWAGVSLITRFEWLLYVFGAFIVFTGFKMIFSEEEGVHPEKNPVIRLAEKFYRVTKTFDGQNFITRLDGRAALTPLAIVLLMVETTDLIFALDSIPAIFGFTTDPFIVFTSNVFAILGLRSLYFVLAGAIDFFRYLKVGLSIVLIFIGVKMLIDPHSHPGQTATPAWWQKEIEANVSLAIVASIILVSVVISVIAGRRERRGAGPPPPSPTDSP